MDLAGGQLVPGLTVIRGCSQRMNLNLQISLETVGNPTKLVENIL